MQLPPVLKTPAVRLLGQKCYASLVENLRVFSDAECRNLAISKALGLGIVVGGSVVKLPQVLKILQNGAGGISLASALLETAGYVVSLAYNVRAGNPFSTYGETLFITVQNVLIASLILRHQRKRVLAAAFPVVTLAAHYALTDRTITPNLAMAYLQMATIPNVAFSRAPQIWQNRKHQSTGQLSIITVFLFFAGALARVFTTLQEVKDNLLLTGFLLGATFNGILLFQILFYWKSAGIAPKAGRKEKREEASAVSRKQRPKKVD